MQSITDEQVNALKNRIQTELSNQLPTVNTATITDEYLIPRVSDLISMFTGDSLLPSEKQELITDIINDFLHLGPLEALLADPTITEIMVNGPEHVYIEQNGKIIETDIEFENDAHIRRIIDRIAQGVNRRCDEQTPYMDARLADGSRVNATIPPVSIDFPTITIRKFSDRNVTWSDYLAFGSISQNMVSFLRACVRSRCNILVSGGTGSGKTTLLNVLSNEIPDDQRIITIEDSAELKLHKPHVVRMETRCANTENSGEITVHDLLVNSLRQRPDRIIVGECRSIEAIEMLQAMNTGHDGSLTTVHANNPVSVFSRIETMVLQGNTGLPSRAIKQQIAQAIDLIVHTQRMLDGSRKVVSIVAVNSNLEGDTIVSEELFRFTQTGINPTTGQIEGYYEGCGVPSADILDKCSAAGQNLDRAWFFE